MLTARPSSSSNRASALTRSPRARRSASTLDLGRVVIVPGGDRRLEIPGLAVPRRVARNPVERRFEKRELVLEPGVGVVADPGIAEAPVPPREAPPSDTRTAAR